MQLALPAAITVPLILGPLTSPSWTQATSGVADSLPTPELLTRFGEFIAMDGDNLVAYGLQLAPSGVFVANDGFVAAYRRSADSWALLDVFNSGDEASESSFGQGLALGGDWLAVGAPFADGPGSGDGYVVLFEFDGLAWNEVQTLFVPQPSSPGNFGYSIAIEGNRMAIGEPGAVVAGQSFSGAVHTYLFDGASWQFEQTLTPNQSLQGDEFGFSIALDGSRMAVGAVGYPAAFDRRGAVYVFEHDGASWTESALLEGADSVDGDRLGWSVDIDGDRIASGAAKHDAPLPGGAELTESGAVYVFEYSSSTDSWTGTDKLLPATLAAGDHFGTSLHLKGSQLTVGAPHDTPFGDPIPTLIPSGAVFRFNATDAGWVEAHRWTLAPDTDPTRLGASVVVDGEVVWSGAWLFGSPGDDSTGAVFGFEAPPIGLEADPILATAGESVSFLTSGGQPGEVAALALDGVGGIDVPLAVVDAGLFDVDGMRSISLPTWPALAGLELRFVAGGFWQTGVVGLSQQVTVVVE